MSTKIKSRMYQAIVVGDANDTIDWVKEYVDEHGAAGTVTKAYVDAQDQSVKSYTDEQITDVNTKISNLAETATKEFTNVYNELENEAQTRSANDLSLSNAIAAEQAARQSADEALQANINAEAEAREGVDEKLINNISDLQTNKQDVLVSSQNIKTINNQSLLGSGNIEIGGGTTTSSALYLWPEGETLGTAKTFNMGTSKRIICKLYVSNSIYGPIYVQCPAYYVFDFSGEKGTTVFTNNYFAFDWHKIFSTYSSVPTQTTEHRKDDTLGVWGWFGLNKPSPSDESRQLRYVYDSTKNTITFAVVDHNDLSYVLEVETI